MERMLYLFSNYHAYSDSRMIHLIVADAETSAWQILETRTGIVLQYLKETYGTKLERVWQLSDLQQGELLQMISWKTSSRFPEVRSFDPPGMEPSESIRTSAIKTSKYFRNPLPM